jgi:hypothetical protein
MIGVIVQSNVEYPDYPEYGVRRRQQIAVSLLLHSTDNLSRSTFRRVSTSRWPDRLAIRSDFTNGLAADAQYAKSLWSNDKPGDREMIKRVSRV